jgi:hydrogenase/urease accessory protein HupE
MRRRASLALLSLLFLSNLPLHAHTSLPGYLELKETSRGTFDMVWRVPTAEGPPPAIYPVFPANCVVPAQLIAEQAPGSVIQRGTIQCGPKGLEGGNLEIEGLPVTILDVFVRITFAGGKTVTQILKPLAASFIVHADGKTRIDALGYVELGVGHILYGIDHLLFVLGLLLIVKSSRLLLKTITAFTVAHTITLGLAVFGVVHVPPIPVEAVIALSIVFLAAEIAQCQLGRTGLTYRKPWIVAFAFGLLHGFGFAGTLSQIGLPPGDIPVALLFFNIGVEVGQIVFVVAVLAFVHSLRSLEIRWPRWTRHLPPYAIGSLASYWFLQRCFLILSF